MKLLKMFKNKKNEEIKKLKRSIDQKDSQIEQLVNDKRKLQHEASVLAATTELTIAKEAQRLATATAKENSQEYQRRRTEANDCVKAFLWSSYK